MGIHFKSEIEKAISANKDKGFSERMKVAQKMLGLAKDRFPEYIDEIKGLSNGARVNMDELWTIAIEDDAYIKDEKPVKCTTIMTNNGKLLAHSEDWDVESKDDLYIIKKTINGLTTLELYFMGTLGGVSAGVNSKGFAVSGNTLFFKPKQIGIPKCLLGRMFLDTRDPESDFQRVKDLKIADGYSHNIISTKGEIFNIEMAVDGSVLTKLKSPYIHSNHCLLLKDSRESENDYIGTVSRLKFAQEKISNQNTIPEIETILEDTSLGTDKSIYNKRTIGRMIVDLENLACYIWLLREKDLGWIKYPIDFIKK